MWTTKTVQSKKIFFLKAELYSFFKQKPFDIGSWARFNMFDASTVALQSNESLGHSQVWKGPARGCRDGGLRSIHLSEPTASEQIILVTGILDAVDVEGKDKNQSPLSLFLPCCYLIWDCYGCGVCKPLKNKHSLNTSKGFVILK